MAYNSAVSRRVIDEIRAKAGRLFFARVPDIVSGFAIAWTAGTYVSTTLPMSVAGVSRKSTGLGTLFTPNAVGADWHALNGQEEFETFAEVPRVMIFPAVPVAECFQAARQRFFPDDGELVLDRRTLTRHCMSCLRTETIEGWQAALTAIRDSLQDDEKFQAWFDSEYAGRKPSIGGPQPLRTRSQAGGDGDFLHLNTDRFGISDVAEASELCDRILSCRDCEVVYAPTEETEERLRYLREIQRKEIALHRSHAEAAALEMQLQEKDAALKVSLMASANLQNQLVTKEQHLHELHGAGQRLREQIEEKHAALEQFRVLMESHSADLQDQRSNNQQLVASNLQLAAATELLRTALIEKHAALHQALDQAAALHQQLLDKHSALHAALDCIQGLRARPLWDRIRNVG
jgi:hypothetical protein